MSGKVPPIRTRARPASRAVSSKIRAQGRQAIDAAALFESFIGRRPRLDEIEIPDMPEAVAVIGPCDFIGYTTVRNGKRESYIHDFAAKDRPLLCVAPDGSQILLIGGDYDFTSRGIVDGSDTKTRRELARDGD